MDWCIRWSTFSRLWLSVLLVATAAPSPAEVAAADRRAILGPMVDALHDRFQAYEQALAEWFLTGVERLGVNPPATLREFRGLRVAVGNGRRERLEAIRAQQRAVDEAMSRLELGERSLAFSVARYREQREALARSAGDDGHMARLDQQIASDLALVSRQLETLGRMTREVNARGRVLNALVRQLKDGRRARQVRLAEQFNRELAGRTSRLREHTGSLVQSQAALRRWSAERRADLDRLRRGVEQSRAAHAERRAAMVRLRAEIGERIAAYNAAARAYNAGEGPAAARAQALQRLEGAKDLIHEKRRDLEQLRVEHRRLEADLKARNARLAERTAGFEKARGERRARMLEEQRRVGAERADLEAWSRAERQRIEALVASLKETSDRELDSARSDLRVANERLAREFGAEHDALFRAAGAWLERGDPGLLYHSSPTAPRFDRSLPRVAALYAAVERVMAGRERRRVMAGQIAAARERLEAGALRIRSARDALREQRTAVEALRAKVARLRSAHLEQTGRERQRLQAAEEALAAAAKGALGRMVKLYLARQYLAELEFAALGAALLSTPDRQALAERYRQEAALWRSRGRRELAALASKAPIRDPGSLLERALRGQPDAPQGMVQGTLGKVLDRPAIDTRTVAGSAKSALLQRWYRVLRTQEPWAALERALRALLPEDDAAAGARFSYLLFRDAFNAHGVITRLAFDDDKFGYQVVVSGQAHALDARGLLGDVLQDRL